MEPVVTVTIKLDDFEFTLDAAQAKELHKILGQLLGLNEVKKNDFLELKELLEKNAPRPIPYPMPYYVPYPTHPRPYWDIIWAMDNSTGKPVPTRNVIVSSTAK